MSVHASTPMLKSSPKWVATQTRLARPSRAQLDRFGTANKHLLAAGVREFDHRAIVIERCASAKIGDCRENVLHRSTLPCHNFQAFAVKHISARILGFGDAI